MKKSLPFIIIVVVLVGGVIALFAFTRSRGTGENNQTFVQNSEPAQPANSTTAAPPEASPDNSAGLTKPNVKVTSPVILEEYGDYQCPPCGALHPVLKQLEHEYGTQLRVVFRHFPLAKIHPNAIAAARAAEAARNQGKFTQMHDQLYRSQTAWKDLADPRPTFIGYANGLGLNVERFKRDVDSVEVEQRIAADMQKGSSVGVTGTPTVFIEGHMMRHEATTPDGLRRGINYMLERKAAS
jgi:protein-disulfide isomerase